MKCGAKECLERIEFKTNLGRSFYFGSRTSVDSCERLNIPENGQVIAFAGELSSKFMVNLQALYIIPESGPSNEGQGNEAASGE